MAEVIRGAVVAARPMDAGGAGPSRRCRKCEQVWALHEYAVDRTRGVNGRRTVCRACDNERRRINRREARVARRFRAAWREAGLP